MGWALESDGAAEPEWPHIRCTGTLDRSRRGWAWHDDPDRRACFTADAVSAPPDLVANAIDGRALTGVDRLLAIAQLHDLIPGVLLRIFRDRCSACGGNHRERAQRALRAVKLIHPDAIVLVRKAQVPEDLLCQPRFLRVGFERRKGRHSIPVWKEDPRRTFLAQTIFAHQYALMNGTPLSGESPGQ